MNILGNNHLQLQPLSKENAIELRFIAPNYRRNHYMTNVLETVVKKFTATVFYFNIDLKNTAAQLMLEKMGATVLDTSLEKKVYYIKGNPHM